MSARSFLVLALAVALVLWASSGAGWMRAVPAALRVVAGVLFVAAAVRIGFSIAIIAFDLAPLSFLIPFALGMLAWLVRPGRSTSA